MLSYTDIQRKNTICAIQLNKIWIPNKKFVHEEIFQIDKDSHQVDIYSLSAQMVKSFYIDKHCITAVKQ